MSSSPSWRSKSSNCHICYSGCDACLKKRQRSIDIMTEFRSSNCLVAGKRPCYQDVFLDSDRGGDVYIKADVSVQNGAIRIASVQPRIRKLPSYGSGKEINIRLESVSNQNTPNHDTVVIELSMGKRPDGYFRHFCTLEPERQV